MSEPVFRHKNTDVRTKALAGLATILTTAYALFIKPAIVGSAGMAMIAVPVVTCLAAALGSHIKVASANLVHENGLAGCCMPLLPARLD